MKAPPATRLQRMIYFATALLRSDDLRGAIWYRTGSEAIRSVLQITREPNRTLKNLGSIDSCD
jgi:hypothetical protein